MWGGRAEEGKQNRWRVIVVRRTLVVDLGSRGTHLYQLGMMSQKSCPAQAIHGQPRECTEGPRHASSALSLRSL